jgi:hypothetical protein
VVDDNSIRGKISHMYDKGEYEHMKIFFYPCTKGDKTQDKLIKVRDLTRNVCMKFQKYYNPHEFLVLDEGTVGEHKEISLSCALRSYTLDLKYDQDETDLETNIKDILRPVFTRGNKVIMENYHSSIQLLRDLKENQVGVLASVTS